MPWGWTIGSQAWVQSCYPESTPQARWMSTGALWSSRTDAQSCTWEERVPEMTQVGERMARECSPEKALGHLAESKLSMSEQCAWKEVSGILGCRNTITRRSKEGTMPIYSALTRSHIHPVMSFESLNTRYVLRNGRHGWLEVQRLCERDSSAWRTAFWGPSTSPPVCMWWLMGCCGAAQEDVRQPAFSSWTKRGSNWRSSDCPPHDESQETEQGTELFAALQVFKPWKDKSLNNPVWSLNWHGFQQGVGLETSQSAFQPEVSNDSMWKSLATGSVPFPKLFFYSKCQGTYSIHSSYALSILL